MISITPTIIVPSLCAFNAAMARKKRAEREKQEKERKEKEEVKTK